MTKYQKYIDRFLSECTCFEKGEIDFGWVIFDDDVTEDERIEVFHYLKTLKPEYSEVMTLISHNQQPAPVHIHFDKMK